MTAAIRAYLDIAFGPAAPELPALVRALDALAMAYHAMPEVAASDQGLDPPETDYNATRVRLVQRFPTLGLYPVADPLDGTSLMSDAIDDIADIADNMTEILWRWDNLGADDAHWHLHAYHAHWGRHLRDLQSLLHAALFER